jgi:hypothetical protein
MSKCRTFGLISQNTVQQNHLAYAAHRLKELGAKRIVAAIGYSHVRERMVLVNDTSRIFPWGFAMSWVQREGHHGCE